MAGRETGDPGLLGADELDLKGEDEAPAALNARRAGGQPLGRAARWLHLAAQQVEQLAERQQGRPDVGGRPRRRPRRLAQGPPLCRLLRDDGEDAR